MWGNKYKIKNTYEKQLKYPRAKQLGRENNYTTKINLELSE